IVLAALVFVLAACSAGRDYTRPELEAPEAYATTPASADSSVARQSWKEFFTDTTLQRLIDRALQNNFDLSVAVTRIDAYQAYAKQAKVAWLPALNAQATASTNNPSENSLSGLSLSEFLGSNHLEDYTLAANLSWEIDVWGKIRRQKEAAFADYLETYEAGRAVQTGVIARVADGYYNLLMMDAQLGIARRNVLLSDSIVRMIQLQKTAGEVTQLAVQQAEAQRQNARILIPQLERAISIQENGLRFLVGDWPGAIPRSGDLTSVPAETSLGTGVPAD